VQKWRGVNNVFRKIDDFLLTLMDKLEPIDPYLWCVRKKWVGKRVEGALERGKYDEWRSTDTGIVTAVHRVVWSPFDYPYDTLFVFFITRDSGEKDWRTWNVREVGGAE
jgi:hypothetical protein